jgi:uncharacterized protein (DUF1778 family)
MLAARVNSEEERRIRDAAKAQRISVAGFIRKAVLAAAGQPAGTEWGVLLDRGDGEPVTLARFEGEHAETDALTMASDHRPAWSVASRRVGPWTPVPGEGNDNAR